MDKVFERVGGLDVHRDTVKACVRIAEPGTGAREEVQTFGTMTADLLAMRDWLQAHGVTHVAMESTGVLWKPVYYTLEEDFTVLLVNAAHMRNVPGRKTDVMDCAWIAQLLQHGLLKPSFVPPKPIRDLRDLTRHRKVLTQARVAEVQRLHKLLQDAGIKLSSVATNILGASGRAMIGALLKGTTDPEALSNLAKGRLRAKMDALGRALLGRFRKHHAFLAGEILAHIDYLEESMERITQELEESIRPFGQEVERLKTIPGVQDKTAQAIVSEIGVDMKAFPTPRNLASWAGVCPGNNESAGKHKSGRARKGNRWLRVALVEAANAAIRDRDTYFFAQYVKVSRKRGHKRAVVAVAHSMLVIAYHLLSRKTTYQELGADYFEKRNKTAIQHRLVQRLERLGFQVTLTSKEVAA